MTVVFGIIWVVLAIVDAGAALLLTLDLFRARTKVARYWAVALLAITVNSLALVVALLLVRKGASHNSQIAGLWIVFAFQLFKTLTMGALALHMRGSIGNPNPKPPTEEQQ